MKLGRSAVRARPQAQNKKSSLRAVFFVLCWEEGAGALSEAVSKDGAMLHAAKRARQASRGQKYLLELERMRTIIVSNLDRAHKIRKSLSKV